MSDLPPKKVFLDEEGKELDVPKFFSRGNEPHKPLWEGRKGPPPEPWGWEALGCGGCLLFALGIAFLFYLIGKP